MKDLTLVVSQAYVRVLIGKPNPPFVTMSLELQSLRGPNQRRPGIDIEMTPGQTRQLINGLLGAIGAPPLPDAGPDVIVDGGGEAPSPPEGA